MYGITFGEGGRLSTKAPDQTQAILIEEGRARFGPGVGSVRRPGGSRWARRTAPDTDAPRPALVVAGGGRQNEVP